MAGEWKFARRQGSCGACGASFAEGAAVYSLLRFDGQELSRGDWCEACFDRRDPAQDLFYWRGRHHAAGGGTVRVDFELLLATVQRCAQDPRPICRDFAFLAALLLVRHRRLRLLGVQRSSGRELLSLRRVRSQECLEVEVRDLDEGRRAELTRVLAGLFDPTQELDLDLRWAAPAETPLETPEPQV